MVSRDELLDRQVGGDVGAGWQVRLLAPGQLDARPRRSPNIPQGAALALEDAWTLAELLLSGIPVADIGPELARRRSHRSGAITFAGQQRADWLAQGVRGGVPAVMGAVARELASPF